MEIRNILSIIAAILVVSCNGNAYCGNQSSFKDTIMTIAETMAGSTSVARKESYNYIRFDKCMMNYNVLGTYPVGDLYDIHFSDIDFSSFNPQASKVGHDYTAFVLLNFSRPLRSRGNFNDLTMNNLVVNVSTDEKALLLLKAFSRLGELCAAAKKAR